MVNQAFKIETDIIPKCINLLKKSKYPGIVKVDMSKKNKEDVVVLHIDYADSKKKHVYGVATIVKDNKNSSKDADIALCIESVGLVHNDVGNLINYGVYSAIKTAYFTRDMYHLDKDIYIIYNLDDEYKTDIVWRAMIVNKLEFDIIKSYILNKKDNPSLALAYKTIKRLENEI